MRIMTRDLKLKLRLLGPRNGSASPRTCADRFEAEIINVLVVFQSESEEVFDVLDNIFCDLANPFVDKLYRSNEFPIRGKNYKFSVTIAFA